MVSADLLGTGGTVYFTYDAAGQRVRKVWEHNALIEERIYLGGAELYRKRQQQGQNWEVVLERKTLHVMDDERRIALVETKTIDTSVPPFQPSPVIRFQLGNHLGSSMLEVDEFGLVISYEEYHPYGTTAYCSGTSAAEVSRKRYRYTGKEQDEETGLYYHGARYYAPWLGRWIAYVIQWSESATRLERIATAKHNEAIEELGGEPFLKSLRSHQKDYGDALCLTEVPGQTVTTTVREALDGFASALRKYALAVTAYGEDDDNGKDAPEIAEALLASLASWEATAGKSRPEGEGAGGELQGDAAPPAAEKDAEAGGTAPATGDKPAGDPT
jgi:RHS repeat-associated protein